MTGALAVYSAVFARYALAVTPKNYLLFGCHVINFSAQLTQGYRWVSYWQWVLPLPYPFRETQPGADWAAGRRSWPLMRRRQ
jgi:Mitochondrial pyruvate carriers